MSDHNTSILTAATALASLVDQAPLCSKEMGSVSVAPVPAMKTPKKQKPLTFPQKLMQVLSIKEYSDIIVWLPRGTAFAIISPKEFVSQILPKYFKKAKYSSFTRKLHRWGFQRRLRGEEAGSYYHKLFQRNDESLCIKMSMNVSLHDSTESMNSTKVPLSCVHGSENDCGAHLPCVEQDMNKQSALGRVSQEVLLPMTVTRHNVTDQSISKQMQQKPSALQASQPTLLESAALVDIGADRMALEQMLISRRLQARYRTALYSRMLMNPLTHSVGQLIACQQRHLQSEILASTRSSALSSNVVNPTPEALFQNHAGNGKSDVGALSMLSMMPPSA